ncbi:MAG TPA: hypothetical protein DCS93_09840 [Microscillaceae bacterium]|nr:hypothetical protein [Microscillaceae bacterium]
MKTVFILFYLLTISYLSFAQTIITGKIVDNKQKPIEFATVGIKNTSWGTTTDNQGEFSLKATKSGTYVLVVSMVGFRKYVKSIQVSSQNTRLKLGTIKLASDEKQLDEIVISEKSVAKEIAEKPITINTINTSLLQAESKDVVNLLDNVQGVKIRQSGGLGGTANITLNGLTGNAVRFYYNGIPIEFLGTGFSVNNIPISNIERVDIYKGVMPADIGTDALGGGINVVTNQNPVNNLDISYQYGSFNTHRIAGSITRKFAQNWYYNLSANYNYSDNDYEMNVENNIYSPDGFVLRRENIRVRRFHDAYAALLLQGGIGYYNEAKKLNFRLGINATSGSKEYQQGVRVAAIPLGEVLYKENGVNLTFNLTKSFGKNWHITYVGNVGFSRLIVDDSTSNVYDWNGNNITAQFPNIVRESGSELLVRPSRSDVYNYNTVHRLGITRDFQYNFSLTLNHFLAYQDRRGTEELAVNYIDGIDPNTVGFRLTKNITSLELKKTLFEKKVELLATGKYYQYTAEGVNVFLINADELPTTSSGDEFWGFNVAGKWKVTDKVFIRGSFEEAIRIPDQFEVFGDLRSIAPNFALRPERSQNINAGLNVAISNFLTIDVNYFLRLQRDLVFLDVRNTSLGRYINRDQAKATGFEVAFTGEPFKNFSYAWNTTYQQVTINGFEDIRDEFLVGKPIPNIPTFFTNLSLTYTIQDFIREGNQLRINAYGYFVDEFSFIQEGGQRNDANWIPVQNAADFGITYTWQNKLSFSAQLNNAFDAELFDFISVPKPGRNFAVKVRYSY